MADLSRRDFLKRGSAALAGMIVAPTIVPNTVLGAKAGKKAPSDKMNILGVGVGGRGAADIAEMAKTENIIGLCDVDWKYAKHVLDKYPDAKKYNDYRKMFDEMLKSADGVMVATADHTHAIIAADAIQAGKHVYVEKPMTLYAYESRLLTKLAAKYKVATQQGNQGASSAGSRKALNWLWNGEIGEVTRIEAFTNRPIWPQGMEAPKTKQYNGPDRLVRLTPLFREELEAAIGELPYAYKMGTPERNIEVNQLFKIVREHGDHLQIPQLNELMGLINLAPWKLIHTFTEHVSSQETQKNYLEVYDPRAEEEGKKE